MISGYIPKKIRYVCRPSISIEPKFNEVEESFFKTSAMPAFPVDSENEKTLETARGWATGWNRYHQNQDAEVHKEVEMDNTEIFEVQIVDLEIRDQGGRAYKVIVHGSFLVDIREDIMLEAMLNKGIRQGSFIACKFIWAKIGAQMKLIRAGSSLHQKLKEAHKRKYQKHVSTKDLVPGTIYSNINNDFLFLGFVKTASINIELKEDRYSSLFSRQRRAREYVAISKTKVAKHQVWLTLSDKKIITYAQLLEQYKKYPYQLDITKNKSVKTSNLPPIDLPDNIIDIVKNIYLHYAKVDINIEDSLLLFNFDKAIMSKYPKDINLNDGVLQKIWNKLEYDK